MRLSDFPEKFNDGTVILIGANASDIEKHAADEIAKFLRGANSLYIRISVFSNTKKIESIKKGHNLVVIGTPKTIA